MRNLYNIHAYLSVSQTSCFANVLISRLHSSRLAGHMTQESEPTCLCFLMQCVSHNRFSPLCVAVRYGSELRARLYGYGWMQSARTQCPGPPQAEATCYTKLMFSRTSILGHGCIHRLTLDCSTALGVQEAKLPTIKMLAVKCWDFHVSYMVSAVC